MEHFQVEEYIQFSTMLNTLQVEHFGNGTIVCFSLFFFFVFVIRTQMGGRATCCEAFQQLGDTTTFALATAQRI